MRRSLLILLVFGPILALAKPDPYPVQMSLYDFAPFRSYDRAVITEFEFKPGNTLFVDGSGIASYQYAFQNSDIHQAITYDSSCVGALLKQAEKAPLAEMLAQGYINQKLHDYLMKELTLWDPRQVRFAITWSRLSRKDLHQVFGKEIPWHRVLRDPDRNSGFLNADPKLTKTWKEDSETFRVVRAVMMVGVGQVFEVGGGYFQASPLAWQKSSEHQNIADLNRTNIKFTAEFSRALVEKAPLPGNMFLPLNTLVGALLADCRAFNVDPKRVLTFARSLDPSRHRAFQRFSAREFTPELKAAFEKDPIATSQTYLEIPRQKNPRAETILVASLAEMGKRFEADFLSEKVKALRVASRGQLSLKQAKALLDLALHHIRTDFDVHWEKHRQPHPVISFDGTQFIGAFLVDKMLSFGMTDEDAVNECLMHFQKDLDLFPDLGAPHWIDSLVTSKKSQRSAGPGFGLLNLDESLAMQAPHYPLQVIASFYAFKAAGLERLSPLAGGVAWQAANDLRLKKGLPAISEDGPGNVHEFLAATNFAVLTESRFLSLHLKSLGAELFEGYALKNGMVTFRIHANEVEIVSDTPGYLALFSGQQIHDLVERTPQVSWDTQTLRANLFERLKYQMLWTVY